MFLCILIKKIYSNYYAKLINDNESSDAEEFIVVGKKGNKARKTHPVEHFLNSLHLTRQEWRLKKGHTIAKHVGTPTITQSTFDNINDAQEFTYETMLANKEAIKQWFDRAKPQAKQYFRHTFDRSIGKGCVRDGSGRSVPKNLNRVRVVLEKTDHHSIKVLTAFPEIWGSR